MKIDGKWVQLDNGEDMHTDKCPAPTCDRSDPHTLHVYHFRNPSLEDMTKKNVDWDWAGNHEVSDAQARHDTWFFDQVRDVSMERFREGLRARIAPLMTMPQDSPGFSRHHLRSD